MDYRSNFPVGSPRWATRRTQWRALGLTEEEIAGPKIAVVNSSSKLAPCFSHLDGIAEQVCDRIRAAGGVGFEIRTVAPTDFIMAAGRRGGYVLSSRDLLAADIEAAVEGGLLDGMVCLASCDKTTPGQLMAAGRLNVPTVIVPCGYQPCGVTDDGEAADIEEVFLKAGHTASGGVTVEDLCALSDRAIAGPGVCTGMGTANTMHIVAEVLGMAPPGSAPVAAGGPRMWASVGAAAAGIVDAVRADRRPRAVVTESSIRNAAAAVIAVSGSVNAVKHLQAIAAEFGLDADVRALFADLGTRVRPLAAVRPNGPDSVESFERAGGAWAVLHQLGNVVERDAVTGSGESLGSVIDRIEHVDPETVRPLDNPRGEHSTIRIVYGSLAPAGGIVKLSVTETRSQHADGPAVVFDDAEAAIESVNAGRIRPGDVLVLRGLGPVGSPGMGMASNVVFALNGAGLTREVAVVTDGQLSGLVNKGIVVGEVAPGSGEGGPLGLVVDGDRISIDLDRSRIGLHVDEEALQERRAACGSPPPAPATGWLGVYARETGPLEQGAVLGHRTAHP